MHLSLLDPCWSMFTARQVNKQKIFIDQWSFVIILFKYPKYFVIKMAKQNDYCDPQGLQFWTILVTWKVQGLLHCAPPLLKIRFQLVSHSSWVMWDCRALWWVRRHKGELPPNWLLDSSKFTSSVGVKSYIGRSMSAWGWSPPRGWEKTTAGKDVKKK